VSTGADDKLKKGAVIASGIFPERVEVVAVEQGGTNYAVIARGLETGEIYDKILSAEQVEEPQLCYRCARVLSGSGSESYQAGL